MSRIYQAPWVPPPGKTSSGNLSLAMKRPSRRSLKIIDPRRSTSADSYVSHSEHERTPSGFSEMNYNQSKVDDKDVYLSPRNRYTMATKSNMDASRYGSNGELGDDARWTVNVMERWTKDVENSITHVANSLRKLEAFIDELVAERRRGLTTGHISRLNESKDDLILHGEMAIRASRELCRWAASIQKHQDRLITEKATSRETELREETNRLKGLLEETTADLSQMKKQLVQQQSEGVRASTFTDSLETLKAHLQRELRQREAECNRLTTQVRGLESRLAEERATLRTKLEASEATVRQLNGTKDALKRAAKAQKKRADQAENTLKDLVERLGKPGDQPIEEQIGRSSRRDDDHLDGRASRCFSPSISSRPKSSRATHRGSGFKDYADLEQENEHLRAIATNYEHRLATAEHEMEELRGSLAQCESMIQTQQRDSDMQAHKLRQLTEQLQSEKVPTDVGDVRPREAESTLIAELRKQLSEANSAREHAERTAEIRASDLRAQLTQADATNRSLQAYLTFLKRSYASVFQPDLAEIFDGVDTKAFSYKLHTPVNGMEGSHPSPEFSPHS